MDGYIYSFNPCVPFNEGTSCNNVTGCQRDTTSGSAYDIGTADKVKFYFDNKNNYLVGTYESDQGTRKSIVNYICDPSVDPPKASVAGEMQPSTYYFSITSKYACSSPAP